MKKHDPEHVRELLEWLGSRLLYDEQDRPIELSRRVVEAIVAILSSLPAGRKGRPKQWDYNTEITAIFDMLGGKPVNDVAHEITERTGQSEASAQRRLWELRKTRRFTNWQQREKKSGPLAKRRRS